MNPAVVCGVFEVKEFDRFHTKQVVDAGGQLRIFELSKSVSVSDDV